MAMIKCPECGSEISDKASACPKCGCPSSEWANRTDDEKSKYWCRHCYRQNEIGTEKCVYCGHELIVPPDNFELKYLNSNGLPKIENVIRCPICDSENCERFVETGFIPAKTKTKTRYTVNLNPLHPFTLVNKKEKTKVLREERTVSNSRILCKNCGHIFS